MARSIRSRHALEIAANVADTPTKKPIEAEPSVAGDADLAEITNKNWIWDMFLQCDLFTSRVSDCRLGFGHLRGRSKLEMRAIGVFVLVLAMASPALAGPENSVIGGKKLSQTMVHSAGLGYPSVLYEWWNKGKDNLDWGLGGELVYGDFPAAHTSRFTKIGLAIDGMVRWHLATREHAKVTNDIAILARPAILISSNRGNSFTFGISGEALVPVSIDVHDRVSVVVGGAFIIKGNINADFGNSGEIPLLFRTGVEIKANDNVAPWFYFDLGPGIGFGGGGSSVGFAWRLAAGTAFWGVMGKGGGGGTSDSGGGGEEIVVEETIVE